MAPQKLKAQDLDTATKRTKITTGAAVTKRQFKKVRFLDNGILDMKRKTGKFVNIVKQYQRESPLLRMPPEIRNKIYGYVLGGKTFALHKDHISNTVSAIKRFRNDLALLAVCRQIYIDTAVLPFSLNTFSFLQPRYMHQWLTKLRPVYFEAITSIQYDPSYREFSIHATAHLLYCERGIISRALQKDDLADFKLPSLRQVCIVSDVFLSWHQKVREAAKIFEIMDGEADEALGSSGQDVRTTFARRIYGGLVE